MNQKEKNFAKRVQEGWKSFLDGEKKLREGIDRKEYGEEITNQCGELLKPAFSEICFELGKRDGKYELILTPEGNRAKLFQIVYFQQRAPKEVLENWRILIGRQPAVNFFLRMHNQDIGCSDVQVWMEQQKGDSVFLYLYCEKLLTLLKTQENQAYGMMYILVDQAIGEMSAMRYVTGIELLDMPMGGEGITLDKLSEQIPLVDAMSLCERYAAYQMKPNDSEDAILRGDVFGGSTCCMPFLEYYYQEDDTLANEFLEDGIVPGFLFWPLDLFADAENRGAMILDFRDEMEAAIKEAAGEDAVTFIGGANGIYHCYLDFMAWDIHKVLEAARKVFEETGLEWAGFHTFRSEDRAVRLK